MAVHNVHERVLPVGPDVLAPLLDGLSGPADRLWPWGSWPAMRLDGPLAVGARGGHGPVRYTVVGYEPGRSLRFEFLAPRGADGSHEFTIHRAGADRAVLRHTLGMRPRGTARLTWPLFLRPLHDALLEDALDRAESAVTGTVAEPARWSPYVRLLRAAATAGRRRRRTDA